jgi:outer membrane protein W
MKKFFIILVITFTWLSVAHAAEIGFKSGLINSYAGDVELFNGQKAKLQDADAPLSLFVQFDKMRVSYTQYTQHASDEYSSGGYTGISSIILTNSVLSFDYLFDIGEGDYPPYAGLGIGLFRSTYTAHASVTDGSSLATLSASNRSANAFDVGFILTVGKKVAVDKGFIGVEASYISKDITHEPNAGGSTPDPINIGGTIIAITAGVNF